MRVRVRVRVRTRAHVRVGVRARYVRLTTDLLVDSDEREHIRSELVRLAVHGQRHLPVQIRRGKKSPSDDDLGEEQLRIAAHTNASKLQHIYHTSMSHNLTHAHKYRSKQLAHRIGASSYNTHNACTRTHTTRTQLRTHHISNGANGLKTTAIG